MTSPLQHTLPFGAAAQTPARQNLIIEAGAGTGKTTAIVAEVLELLLGNEDLGRERIVLMTFTEKAAGEIADLIHQALAELELQFAEWSRISAAAAARSDSTSNSGADSAKPIVWPTGSANPLFTVPPGREPRYRRACARQLARIDGLRSQTIHSFCQSLLRMLPIEAGLDPQFKIIEGFERSLLYGQMYDAWADQETRGQATPEKLRDWEVVLTSADYLFRVRELIFSLLNRRDLLDETYTTGGLEDIRETVEQAVQTLRTVDSSNVGEPAILRILEYVRQAGFPAGDGASIDAWIDWFEPVAADIRSANLPAGRGNADLKNAMKVLRADDKKGDSIYDALVSHRAAIALLALTRRFIAFLDAEKRARGVVDFDDLLLRTAALLDDPAVAERVRQQFDYIFVDEFQDTDRTQARIIERIGTDRNGHWVPGKTVIVGDPKQSIYGFRRADPETYRNISTKMLKDGAKEKPLDNNYRSDAPLLDAFNKIFDCVFASAGDDPNVFRPRYRALNAAKTASVMSHSVAPLPSAAVPAGNEEHAGEGSGARPESRITFLHSRGGEGDERQISEAEAIAEWIKSRRVGGERDLQRFAILFRRLTRLDDYLDTLDRHGIRYVLPPTRAFLERRAPVDLLAVLRAIAHPFDPGAVISAARTPYFALTDDEIGEGALAGNDAWQKYKDALEAYGRQAEQLSVSSLIDLIVETSGIETIYEATADGTRSLRHLEHLRALAFEYDEKAGGSLRQFIAEIDRRRLEPDETEPSLADDDSNAVRILTVHAAKGLEFETVIIPDIASSARGRDSVQIFTSEDPAALVVTGGVQTLSARFHFTASGAPLKSIAGDREDAEMRRLFYVATTRAKTDVVFVCTPSPFRTEGFFKCLTETFGFEKTSFESMWPDEPGRLVRELPNGVAAAFDKTIASVIAADENAEADLSRAQKSALLDAALLTSLVSGELVPLDIDAPTQVIEMLTATEAVAGRAGMKNMAAGTLLHRVLERWDGRCDPAPLVASLAAEAAADDRTVAAVRRRIVAIHGSAAFARIATAETIGREMPLRFVDEKGRAVERRIDRLLRENGREVVVDYKSGAPSADRLTRDREQVSRYCRAIEKITGRPCSGFLWYIDDERDEMVDV